MFKKSNPVWCSDKNTVNQYVAFQQLFDGIPSKKITLTIRADSQYIVWLNGRLIGTNQYADYSFYPVYDTYIIDPEWFLESDNLLACLGYCQNENSSTYRRGDPSVIFEMIMEDETIMHSGSETRCSTLTGYFSGPMEKISNQLSYSFFYDSSQYSGWIEVYQGESPDWQSATVGKRYEKYYPRPVEKLLTLPMKTSIIQVKGIYENHGGDTPAQRVYYSSLRPIIGEIDEKNKNILLPSQNGILIQSNDHLSSNEGYFILIDLGCETAGYLSIDIEVSTACCIDIGYGEHIDDLRVRSYVGGRHFGCGIVLKKGRNQFTHYFKRIAGRYLQLHIPSPTVRVFHAGIIPVEYPLKVLSSPSHLDRLEQRIYQVSVDTLKLCMHEHYEDSPWREQALYAMDARNQMLCGYYAFEEFVFARENLRLLAYGIRPDGLLELCAPSKIEITIPAFSLVWICALEEYGAYSNDITFLSEMFPTALTIINTFIKRTKNSLVPVFKGEEYWNFYEWSEGLDGWSNKGDTDAALNAFYALALNSIKKICSIIGKNEDAKRFETIADALKTVYNQNFWDKENQAYRFAKENNMYAELVQALVICSNLCTDKNIAIILNKFEKNQFEVPITLSHSIYKYEALLKGKGFEDYVREDIADVWGSMLYKEASSFWETIKGSSDFERAGSLCHGWSAIPVYIYHQLANR